VEFEQIKDGMVKPLSAANGEVSGDVRWQVDTCVAEEPSLGVS